MEIIYQTIIHSNFMKIRISILILLIIGTVACHRQNCTNAIFRPEMCEINPIPFNHTDAISGESHTGSMFLIIHLTGTTSQSCTSIPSLSMGAEAMAKPGISYVVWEAALRGFEIRSNHDFNDIPAGELLNNKLVGLTYYKQKVNLFNYLTPFFNNNPSLDYNEFRFEFTQMPQHPIHTFTVTFRLADGRVLEGTSEEVIWE